MYELWFFFWCRIVFLEGDRNLGSVSSMELFVGVIFFNFDIIFNVMIEIIYNFCLR